MNPTLHPRLLNGRAGDPAVYVEAMHAPGAVLFDCGDVAALSPRHILRLEAICVSHAHMDHWADVDRVLRFLVGREKTLHFVGPPGFIARLHHRLASYTWNLVDRIAADLVLDVTEVGAAESARAQLRLHTAFTPEPLPPAAPEPDGTVLRLAALRLRAALLDHGTPSLGFALEEAKHLNIWRTRARRRGLPIGPWLAVLKRAVAEGLPDDHPVPVFARGGKAEGAPRVTLGELRELVVVTPGQRVAYLTDFADTPANRATAVALAHNSDTLFIEAPFFAGDAVIASERMHLTTRAAGTIAQEAGVRRVEPFTFPRAISGRKPNGSRRSRPPSVARSCPRRNGGGGRRIAP